MVYTLSIIYHFVFHVTITQLTRLSNRFTTTILFKMVMGYQAVAIVILSCFFSTISSFSISTVSRMSSASLKMAFGGLFSQKPKAAEKVSIKFSIMGVPDSEKLISAEVGAALEEVALTSEVPINYKCRKGECGTCLVNVDNKWVKACQTTVPSVLSHFTGISFLISHFL